MARATRPGVSFVYERGNLDVVGRFCKPRHDQVSAPLNQVQHRTWDYLLHCGNATSQLLEHLALVSSRLSGKLSLSKAWPIMQGRPFRLFRSRARPPAQPPSNPCDRGGMQMIGRDGRHQLACFLVALLFFSAASRRRLVRRDGRRSVRPQAPLIGFTVLQCKPGARRRCFSSILSRTSPVSRLG